MSLLPVFVWLGFGAGLAGATWVVVAAAAASSAANVIDASLLLSPIYVCLGPGQRLGALPASSASWMDSLAATTSFTTTAAATATITLATTANRQDPHLRTLTRLLGGFTGCFLLLLQAESGLWLLVGWELIGLYSWWLIGWWGWGGWGGVGGGRAVSSGSAGKAILVNRASDALQVWAVGSAWWWGGTMGIAALSDLGDLPAPICLAYTAAASGKSAQLVFHGWLGDAMEGPTPVSALMHAATLVVAGVYALVRLGADGAGGMFAGAATATAWGLVALGARDLKLAIAASTGSQMGLAFLSRSASPGHLLAHASYKAALFLAAGLALSALTQQHTARSSSPAPAAAGDALLTATLSLSATPALSGYTPKETLLALPSALPDAVRTTLFATALLTSCYSFALLWCVVIAEADGSVGGGEQLQGGARWGLAETERATGRARAGHRLNGWVLPGLRRTGGSSQPFSSSAISSSARSPLSRLRGPHRMLLPG